MVFAVGRQIIGGGGGAPINKSQRRRPQIVGGGGARLYFGSPLDSYSVSCAGSNEETGCSLHVTNRLPIDPENPRGPVGLVAPSSASNRWRRGSSLAWNRHTSHCSGCSKDSSSRRITPAVCPVFTFVPSHPTTFKFCVFAFSSFRLATRLCLCWSLIAESCG